VIHDVSLRIDAGEIVGLIGPNGAGKTTLLRCVTALCRPLRGSVRLLGKDTHRLSASERARLAAVVPPELETPMAFSVEELVAIGRTASADRWRGLSAKDMEAVETALANTDMRRLRNRLLTELSAGEKQRAVVAMALAQSPRVILMDEPTSHLDMIHCFDVMRIVRRLNREDGATVLMISHDLNTAARFCDRLLLMSGGRIIADGSPRTVLTEPGLALAYGCAVTVSYAPPDNAVTVFPSTSPERSNGGKNGPAP
jgi:iron complex transport system ATP-binding protein